MISAPVLAVFVPTAIGAGLVTSLVLVVVDTVGQLRSTRQRRRTTRILGASTAAAVREGSSADASRIGLRSRRAALVAGFVSGSIGVYGLIGSFWNYWNPEERFRGLAWLWAVSWLAASAFVAVGVAALLVASTERPLRGVRRRLLISSPLGVAPVERAPVAVTTGEGGAEQVLGEEQDRGAEEEAGDDV